MRTPRVVLLALTITLALAGCGGVESETGLSAAQEQQLVDLGRLRPDEHVLFYTSRGEDMDEAGSFFTETRVASYWTAGGDDEEVSIDLKDVAELKLTVNEDSWTYAGYVTVISGRDAKETKVYLQSDAKDFPLHFYQALRKQWEKVKKAAG
jgi:hypothetical protein